MDIVIRPEWVLKKGDGDSVSLPLLLRLLSEVRIHGSISGAANSAELSYRHAWGLLQEFERQFGMPLVQKVRGQGTVLSPLAEKLIWADKRIAARLSPVLESLASELERELEALLVNKRQAVRLVASHGFAVDALVKQLAVRDVMVDLRYRNSSEAVAALSRGECHLAGFHLPIGAFQQAALAKYLQWLDPQRHVLIHLAYRTQGLFAEKGNPKRITALHDLVRPDVRFVNRQVGSGTRVLLELLLAKEELEPQNILGFETTEFTHSAVAAYIASGMADASFGVETAARRFDLDFVPILRERYFFACNRSDLQQPTMEAVLNVMRSGEYQSIVSQLAGYDGKLSGTLTPLEDFLTAAR